MTLYLLAISIEKYRSKYFRAVSSVGRALPF